MKIQILGTRGEVKSVSAYHKRHSGVLIDGEILLDLGEEEYLNYEPKYIFITHLHADHAFFVKSSQSKVNENIIYLPEKYSRFKKSKLIDKTKQFQNYEIIPIPTTHSAQVNSQAYLVKKKQEKILYTGDMISIDKKYHKLLENTDVVITDGSYIRQNGLIKIDKKSGKLFGHTGIPDLIKFFSQFTHHIIFVHFGSWFYKDSKYAIKKIQSLGREYNIIALTGYDGMNVDTKLFNIN